MKPSESQTLEQVFFERMGVSVEDAVATGADVIDETASRAVDNGIRVDERVNDLGGLLEKLTQPQTLAALSELVERLPQLVELSRVAAELPNIMATLGDIFENYQERYAEQGIDVEKAFSNGLNSMLYLGNQVDMEHLKRIGDLLASDILNPHALNVVDNAAKSLNTAQESICGTPQDRVGMFGMLKALRDPKIQRSLAFAVQFGKCFGENIDQNSNP